MWQLRSRGEGVRPRATKISTFLRLPLVVTCFIIILYLGTTWNKKSPRYTEYPSLLPVSVGWARLNGSLVVQASDLLNLKFKSFIYY